MSRTMTLSLARAATRTTDVQRDPGRGRSRLMALAAGALLLVGSSAATGPASAARSPVADGVVKAPEIPRTVPSNACTVTVNGEKVHGTFTYGSSWCCHENAAGNEECFNCDVFTCSGGWNLTGQGGGIPEFVEP